MKILNKTLLAGILFASALLSGCSEDDYTPGEASNANGINVYFESPVGAEVSIGPDDTAFTITVGRNQTDGALSVPLKMASVYADLFEIPAQVDFAQGESSKTLTIKVSSDMAMFESYPMTLTIDPAYTQAYTQSDLYLSPSGTERYQGRLRALCRRQIQRLLHESGSGSDRNRSGNGILSYLRHVPFESMLGNRYW